MLNIKWLAESLYLVTRPRARDQSDKSPRQLLKWLNINLLNIRSLAIGVVIF